MELTVFIFSTMIGVGLVAFLFCMDRAFSFSASSKNQQYLMRLSMLVPIGLVGLIAVILAA